MMDQKKIYISCPVCSKVLLKVAGDCEIEIVCKGCGKRIIGTVKENHVHIFEDERKPFAEGNVRHQLYVRVFIQKTEYNLLGERIVKLDGYGFGILRVDITKQEFVKS